MRATSASQLDYLIRAQVCLWVGSSPQPPQPWDKFLSGANASFCLSRQELLMLPHTMQWEPFVSAQHRKP